MNKVGICGVYGKGRNLLNGQTVKTIMFTEELQKQLSTEQVMKIDTFNWRRNPLRLIMNCFRLIKECENIVILPAQNGVKVFVPLFLLFNCYFHRKIHYVVIGGWLPHLLSKKKYLNNMVKKLDGVYAETQSMIYSLQELGLSNVKLLNNFKSLEILSENQFVKCKSEPFKLCTFSRVMEEKGIEDAISVISEINKELGRTAYILDIFGPIETAYLERFKMLEKQFPDFVNYKGYVNSNESVHILKEYYILLFPTRFKTEGIPGTIIDAYASGLPVICSQWESANDIVINNETGFIYEFLQNQQLKEILLDILENPQLVIKMKSNCITKAREYLPNKVIKEFVKSL